MENLIDVLRASLVEEAAMWRNEFLRGVDAYGDVDGGYAAACPRAHYATLDGMSVRAIEDGVTEADMARMFAY